MSRTTDTLFLRLDPPLVRTVKEMARKHGISISAYAEQALRSHINDTTDAAHRTELLQATEQALMARVEQRITGLFTNIRGLYAKEALDTALAVDLMKRMLAIGIRDKHALANVIYEARKEAHRRVSARSEWSGPLPPEAEAKLSSLQEENTSLKEEIARLKTKVDQLEAYRETERQAQAELRTALDDAMRQASTAERRADRHEQRYSWAIQQYEQQGMIKRKSVRDFLADFDRTWQ